MNSLNSLELENKNIVLRVDLNVPIQDGKILDRTRIDAVRPTVDFLLSQDSRILLISHLGLSERLTRFLSLEIIKNLQLVLQHLFLFYQEFSHPELVHLNQLLELYFYFQALKN